MCWVFPKVILLFLPLVAAGAVVPFQNVLKRLAGIITTLRVEGCGIRVRAALRLTLLQVVGLGLAQRAAVIGQRRGFFNLRRPLKGLIILQAEANSHLYREAAIFIDQDTLLNVFVHERRSGLGVGADTVAVRLL